MRFNALRCRLASNATASPTAFANPPQIPKSVAVEVVAPNAQCRNRIFVAFLDGQLRDAVVTILNDHRTRAVAPAGFFARTAVDRVFDDACTL